MTTVGRLNVILGARVRGLLAGLRKSETAMRSASENFNQLAASAARVSAAFTAAGGAIAFVTAGFEKQLTRAASIADNTGTQFESIFEGMSNRALELAGSTEFTAREVGEGMTFMAMAGNDAATIMEAMPSVLQLASAAAIDLGSSADIVTNVMAGFGITMEQLQKQMDAGADGTEGFSNATELMGKELKDANNVLVATFTNSNTSLQELGASFKKVGPASKLFGVSLEDTAAVLGVLGNAGIKAEEAGTGLRRAMVAISSSAPKVQKAMRSLGLETDDLQKRGLLGVINQLQHAREEFSRTGRETEFQTKLFDAFGLRAGPIMGALLTQGIDSVVKLRKTIGQLGEADIAKVLEERQLATFTGQFNLLRSNIEALVISIGQQLLPILRPIVKGFSDVLKRLQALSPSTKKFIAVFLVVGAVVAGVVAALATVAAAVTGAIASFAAFAFMWPAVAFVGALLLKLAIIAGAVGLAIGILADVFEEEMRAIVKGVKESNFSVAETFKVMVLTVLATMFELADGVAVALDVIGATFIDVLFGIPQLFAVVIDLLSSGFVKLLRAWEETTVQFVTSWMKAVNQIPGLSAFLGFDESEVQSAERSIRDIFGTARKAVDTGFTKQLEDFKNDIKDTTFKFGDIIDDPARLAEQTVQAVKGAFESAARGFGKIMDAVFEDGGKNVGDEIANVLKDLDVDLGNVTGITPGGGSSDREKLTAAQDAARASLQDFKDSLDNTIDVLGKLAKGDFLGAAQSFATKKLSDRLIAPFESVFKGKLGPQLANLISDDVKSAATDTARAAGGAIVGAAVAAGQFVMDMLKKLTATVVDAAKGLASDIGGGRIFDLIGKGMKTLVAAIAAAVIAFISLVSVAVAVVSVWGALFLVALAALAAFAAALVVATGAIFPLAGAFLGGFAFAQIGDTDMGQNLFSAFSNALKDAAEPLLPLTEGLFALVPIVRLIVKAMNVLAATMLSGLPEALFMAFKQLGIVVLTAAIAFESFRIEFQEQISRVQGVVGTLILVFSELQVAMVRFGNWIDTFLGRDTTAGEELLSELEQGVADQRASLDEAAAGFDDTSEAMSQLRGMLMHLSGLGFDDAVEAGMRFADGLNELNDSISESVTNVPQGLKVSLLRFRSIQPGQGTAPIETATGASQPIAIENIFLVAENLEQMQQQIFEVAEQASLEQSGSLSGRDLRGGTQF